MNIVERWRRITVFNSVAKLNSYGWKGLNWKIVTTADFEAQIIRILEGGEYFLTVENTGLADITMTTVLDQITGPEFIITAETKAIFSLINDGENVIIFQELNSEEIVGGGATEEYVDDAVDAEALLRIAGDDDLQSQITALEGIIDTTLKAPEPYTPAGGLYPTTYGGEAITKGDTFRLGAGNMGNQVANAEDLLVALADSPGQIDANWHILESNRDQATEALKGVAKIATQAIIEDEATTNDEDVITSKKWWQGWAKGLTLSGFFAAVRGTVMTGLSLADGSDVVATDTVLAGMGKLQKQIDDFVPGGLTNFTEGRNDSSPNGAIPVVFLIPNTSDTNNHVVIGAKGTGAISAHVSDGVAAGGSPRGTYSVDFQHRRELAAEVAAAIASFMGSGYRNSIASTAIYGVLPGGYFNALNGQYSNIDGGHENYENGGSSVIGGGYNNDNRASFGVISGGDTNEMPSYLCEASAIPGGRNNYNDLVPYAFQHGRHSRATLFGTRAHAAGFFSANGDSQRQEFLPRISTAGLTTGATTIVRADGVGATYLMIPYTNNKLWKMRISWQAVVTAIAGTATGVTVGDVITAEDRLTVKRVGGTTTVVGTTADATPHSDGLMSTCAMAYTIGGSNDVVMTFTAPTFAGGGSVTCRVNADVRILETGW
jgi:hypothetical protein